MAKSGNASFDGAALLQELKTNRRTQVALGAFVLMLAWLFWPEAPKAKRRPGGASAPGGAVLAPQQRQNLQRLPDLASLDRAGEVPEPSELVRDVFLFDKPVKQKPVEAVRPPEPPPVHIDTPEEAEAKRKAAAEAAELSTAPNDLRYLGYLKGEPSGTIAAFMKGEEAVTLKQGQKYGQHWTLVRVTDTQAEFQNTVYPNMKKTLESREGAANAPVSNEF